MKVFNTVQEIIQWRAQVDSSKIIGFVPTMGCLHEGHRSLIKTAREENDVVVVSIFVNPSQFAPNEDLDNYPRTLINDKAMLEELKVDALFLPTEKEMYPPNGIPLDPSKQIGTFVNVQGISSRLEGKTRPNFFRGVCTIVIKLFNIVRPNLAYFGQKDIQQFIILQKMVDDLFMTTLKLRLMPIIRGDSGLALSSRNNYLSQTSKDHASFISKGLQVAEKLLKENKTVLKADQIQTEVKSLWKKYIDDGEFKIDYISIADFKTLDEVDVFEPTAETNRKVIISTAVYVKDPENPSTIVRLIDNIIV